MELETLLSNLYAQTMFAVYFIQFGCLILEKIDVQTFEVRNVFMEFPWT